MKFLLASVIVGLILASGILWDKTQALEEQVAQLKSQLVATHQRIDQGQVTETTPQTDSSNSNWWEPTLEQRLQRLEGRVAGHTHNERDIFSIGGN
jgi:hypothetical protein